MLEPVEIDWNEKMRPKGPRVRIIATDEKPALSAAAGTKRKLWEALTPDPAGDVLADDPGSAG